MVRVRHADDGFSLLEVLFASFIAFFVLSALFSVLVMSSSQGRIANADTVATQLGQLVVEQARSLPYDSIGTTSAPSGQPVGVLASNETTHYQGLIFDVVRQVTWVDDPSNNANTVGDVTKDYKQLLVQVAWRGGHTTPIVTYIRDKSNESPVPPLVVWKTSPPPNSVLFTLSGTTRVWDRSSNPSGTTGDVASLQASASIDASIGTVIRVEFWSGTNMFLAGTGSATSLFAPSSAWPCMSSASPNTNPYTGPYPINLAARDTSSNALLFPEGKNTLKVVAYSNGMAYGYQMLNFTVDNRAAEFASGSTVVLSLPPDNTDRYNGSIVASWTPPLDGLDPTTFYDVTIQPNGGTAVPYLQQNLGPTGSAVLGVGMPATFLPTSFSAYKVTLLPKSVRGVAGSTTAASVFAPNCPRLTGTIFNQAANKKAANNFRFDLTVSAPQDGLAELLGGTSIVYDVYTIDSSTYTYPGYGDLPSSATLAPNDQAGPTMQVQSGLVSAEVHPGGGTGEGRFRRGRRHDPQQRRRAWPPRRPCTSRPPS